MVVVVFAASEWQCARCGSTRARRAPSGRLKGCADCHRTRERPRSAARAAARKAADDFEITPAIRAYLAAFDRYLAAGKAGDSASVRAAEDDRSRTLAGLRHETRG